MLLDGETRSKGSSLRDEGMSPCLTSRKEKRRKWPNARSEEDRSSVFWIVGDLNARIVSSSNP